mgnify:CR=1 FL=1
MTKVLLRVLPNLTILLFLLSPIATIIYGLIGIGVLIGGIIMWLLFIYLLCSESPREKEMGGL